MLNSPKPPLQRIGPETDWSDRLPAMLPVGISFEPEALRNRLQQTDRAWFIIRDIAGRYGLAAGLEPSPFPGAATHPEYRVCGYLPAKSATDLGSAAFRETFGVQYAYMTGSMANGIASEALVVAGARAGFLSSFGAAGLAPARVEQAIRQLRQTIPERTWASNLIHSPNEPAMEQACVDLYLRHGVSVVEASAFIELTPALVQYRAAGIEPDCTGRLQARNRILAKVSRTEVARRFLEPPPARLLRQLVEAGRITEQQAQWAATLPMADALTGEADSGGHTDNRPLVSLLPQLIGLRNGMAQAYPAVHRVMVGAAGGIGTPEAIVAALVLGADYVLTGSINQSCTEAGTSLQVKQWLAEAEMADMMMAPAADMFELGASVQVLKRGTLFGVRAQKLYDMYRLYDSWATIPERERNKIERQIFRRSYEAVWQETQAFFRERDPAQLDLASQNPKHRLALVFRWYLGQSSVWANTGLEERQIDYQVWCGPAMGAFNQWVPTAGLETPQQRTVAKVGHALLEAAARYWRQQYLREQGFESSL